MKKTLLFLLLLPATIVWGQSNNVKKVTAAVEALHNALVTIDTNSLKKLTADNLSFGHSSGTVEDKQTLIHTVVNGPLRFTAINTTNQTVTPVKRTAIVRYVLVAKATNNGVPTDIKLGVLQVWQKQRGSWKLLARQAVTL